MLGSLRPLRGHRTADLIRWGESKARLRATIEMDEVPHKVGLTLESRQRTLEMDGDRVQDVTAYFNGFRAVAFVPQDGAILTGEPNIRRRWLDRAAFNITPSHLVLVRDYRRVVLHKQAVLKEDKPDMDLLDVLDSTLAAKGAELVERRHQALQKLLPEAQRLHQEICASQESLRMELKTAAVGSTLQERQQALQERLQASREGELRRGTTLVGPQLDDVRIWVDEQSARHYASRGQIRSVVLSLKVAGLRAAGREGHSPVFLVDDLSSELDQDRTARLLGCLRELGTQVFVTTTDPGSLLAATDAGEVSWIRVEQGEMHLEDPGKR